MNLKQPSNTSKSTSYWRTRMPRLQRKAWYTWQDVLVWEWEMREENNRILSGNRQHIVNTYFKLPPGRLYTWKSLVGDGHRIVRNPIDYVIKNRKYRNTVVSVKLNQKQIIHQIITYCWIVLIFDSRKKNTNGNDVRKPKQHNFLHQDKINKELKNILENKDQHRNRGAV